MQRNIKLHHGIKKRKIEKKNFQNFGNCLKCWHNRGVVGMIKN